MSEDDRVSFCKPFRLFRPLFALVLDGLCGALSLFSPGVLSLSWKWPISASKRYFFSTIFCCLGFFSGPVLAEGLDLSLSGGGRTFPAAGTVEAQMGLSWNLWGDPRTEKGGHSTAISVEKLMYGYFRFFGGGGGAGEYTEGQIGAEIFPISFLGLRGKKTWFQNYADYSDYDCKAHLCRGKFSDGELEGVLYLGASRFFLQGAYARIVAENRGDGIVTDYIHPLAGMNLWSGKENRLEKIKTTLGFQLTSSLFVSGLYVRFRNKSDPSQDSLGGFGHSGVDPVGQTSEMKTFNLHFKFRDFHFFVGGGEYRSDIHNTEPTFVAGFTWGILP